MSSFKPIIAKCDNGDGTLEVVAGSTFPFSMRIERNNETVVIPSERDEYGYYYAEATLSSNTDTRKSK